MHGNLPEIRTTSWWINFRCWLIKLLAGKHPVVINAEISGQKGLVLQWHGKAVVVNSILRDFDGAAVTIQGVPDESIEIVPPQTPVEDSEHKKPRERRKSGHAALHQMPSREDRLRSK